MLSDLRASTLLICQAAAVTTLLAAEAIHISVIEAHWAEWVGFGVFFTLIAILEGAVAVAVALAPARRAACLAGIVISLGTVAVWAVSRTVGVPFGPEPGEPEAIGVADVVCSALEVVTAVALVPLLRARWTGWRGRTGPAVAVAIAAVVAVLTVVAVRSPEAHGHADAMSAAGFDVASIRGRSTAPQGGGAAVRAAVEASEAAAGSGGY